MKNGLILKELLIEYQEKWLDKALKLYDEITRSGQAGSPHKGGGLCVPTAFGFAIVKAEIAHALCGPF